MNTMNSIDRHWRRYLIGIAVGTLAGTGLLAAPPATASQDTNGGCTIRADHPRDIAEIVTERKVAMAQDRIDRAWLYL